jgi:glutathione synthase/RimK-type ligase-like ATP-grasp enzyme
MKVAFQMDPIGSVNIDADSTFRLAEEAQARGCSCGTTRPIICPSGRGGSLRARNR